MSKSEEEFEDTKGVTRIRKSKNREHNGQKKKKETHQTEKQQKLVLVAINIKRLLYH